RDTHRGARRYRCREVRAFSSAGGWDGAGGGGGGAGVPSSETGADAGATTFAGGLGTTTTVK
ncbi:MAG: hypothetical protein ABL870_02395, partial [Sediminibacterium sp.]